MPAVALCSFEGPEGAVSRYFPVALARGKHLFPFRTEQLSPSAPMVLGPRGPGRVGRRRFFVSGAALGRPVVFRVARALAAATIAEASRNGCSISGASTRARAGREVTRHRSRARLGVPTVAIPQSV